MTNNKKFILVYSINGEFIGFYDDMSLVLSKGFKYYNYITEELHDYILSNANNLIVNTTIIDSREIVIDNSKFLKPKPKNNNLDLHNKIAEITNSLKQSCSFWITHGLEIKLYDSEHHLYSYKLEDQINLQQIINSYKPGDSIYYHAEGEKNQLFSYDDLLNIYKELYNNKLYHLLYTNIICDYIKNNYTKEDHNNKLIIEYGFITDECRNELEAQYAKQHI